MHLGLGIAGTAGLVALGAAASYGIGTQLGDSMRDAAPGDRDGDGYDAGDMGVDFGSMLAVGMAGMVGSAAIGALTGFGAAKLLGSGAAGLAIGGVAALGNMVLTDIPLTPDRYGLDG